MSLPRTLLLACALVCLVSMSAQARTRAVESDIVFDRHTGATEIGSRMFVRESGKRMKSAGLKHLRAKKRKLRDLRDPVPVKAGDHVIVASSGAKASVSMAAKPRFTCLLNKLEAVGYHVDFMGGYASRGNSSAHPTGNALDINQTARNVVTRRLPSNATEMARDCGLVHGAVWSNPDQGHFEMPRKYGYVIKHRRVRYAQAR